eukprot:1191472-Prymnesium_polylepis.2
MQQSAAERANPAAFAYVPKAEPLAQGPVLVQPIDPSQVKKQTSLTFSVNAKREDYENDPELLQRVCAAGGYDRDLWRTRYSQEAFCTEGLDFCGS